MTDHGSDRCQCFCTVQMVIDVVIVDIVECSDSKDGGKCVVRILKN